MSLVCLRFAQDAIAESLSYQPALGRGGERVFLNHRPERFGKRRPPWALGQAGQQPKTVAGRADN